MATQSIEALTIPALSAALDAATLRQQVIAANIANANTQGFQAKQVSFQAQIEARSTSSAAPLASAALGLQVRLQPHLTTSGDGSVKLDQEVAHMAQNNTHYQALLRALNRHFSILSSAISEGKR